MSVRQGWQVQAVSKWETGASCPDISLLPRIADYFAVSIDELFYGRQAGYKTLARCDLPDDGVFRVVQAVGKHILKAEQYNERKVVKLALSTLPDPPPVLEFRAPTVITGDLHCKSLQVSGDLKVLGVVKDTE